MWFSTASKETNASTVQAPTRYYDQLHVPSQPDFMGLHNNPSRREHCLKPSFQADKDSDIVV